MKHYFDSLEFQQKYHCNIPLGSFCRPDGTTFRLWAPTAEIVTLNLYQNGTGSSLIAQIDLLPEEQGLWSCEIPGNLDGTYYDYEVTAGGVCRRTADPYARACGLNGERSMVIDLRRTDPEGWDQDQAPSPKPETVIYEVHIKDFSWDPASGVKPEFRGKFKAFCEEDTTLNGDGIHPTGIAYLKDLGVTHIQLMPVFDYGSIDEGGEQDQFNWGYDPMNYNVPEGSYATDPYHGEVRIRELKEAIQALHRSGFRVIMDVVYNHTYHLDSWLWRTVPWYYYRQNEDGTPSDGSRCGNELATERSMCAKYILDSVLYWAEEYHIDGFRFDLMGLIDVELMKSIRSSLDQRWGKGEKLLYGEPWAAADSAVRSGTELTTKRTLVQLDDIGAFCDATRDAVKGKLSDVWDAGFANGRGLNAEHLVCCLRGWAGPYGDFSVNAPSQTINYLSCHDDWTLWDKLVLTLDHERCFDNLSPEVLRANRFAAAINFTCQGRLLLLSGEEFGRTKQGVKNTYNTSLYINRFDWQRAWENRALAEYYKGLIALRMRLPGLCDKSRQASGRVFDINTPAPDCAAMQVDNTGGNSPWKKLFLAYNASQAEVRLTLPDGKWDVLVDAVSSTKWKDPTGVTGSMSLPAVSAAILGQR